MPGARRHGNIPRHSDIPGRRGITGGSGRRLPIVFGMVNAIALALVLGIISIAALVLVVKLSRSR